MRKPAIYDSLCATPPAQDPDDNEEGEKWEDDDENDEATDTKKRKSKSQTLGDSLTQGMGTIADALVKMAELTSNGKSKSTSSEVTVLLKHMITSQEDARKEQMAVNHALLDAIKKLNDA